MRLLDGSWARVAQGAMAIAREMARVVLRHPVVGVVAVPLDGDGRVVLMRRRDTGTWCLPGGTVEWGESLAVALGRELREETGRELAGVGRVVGVYSRPERDPRFHAVCVVVEATIADAATAADAINPLEVIEVRAFARHELPSELAFDTRRMIEDWERGSATVLD